MGASEGALFSRFPKNLENCVWWSGNGIAAVSRYAQSVGR